MDEVVQQLAMEPQIGNSQVTCIAQSAEWEHLLDMMDEGEGEDQEHRQMLDRRVCFSGLARCPVAPETTIHSLTTACAQSRSPRPHPTAPSLAIATTAHPLTTTIASFPTV